MGDPSAARGLLMLIAGVWLLARVFKGGLADRLAKATASS